MRISDNNSHLSFILLSQNFPRLHNESGGVKTMESYVCEIKVLKMHQKFFMHNEINNKVSKYKKNVNKISFNNSRKFIVP